MWIATRPRRTQQKKQCYEIRLATPSGGMVKTPRNGSRRLVMKRGLPAWLTARLALAIALDSAVQLLWKLAALQLPGSLSPSALAAAALHQPLFLLLGALFVWQLANWLRVLEASDLSYSQPITSLSFVSVFALSVLFLGERVDAAKIFGIAFVFAGVWLIGRTPHDRRAGAAGTP